MAGWLNGDSVTDVVQQGAEHVLLVPAVALGSGGRLQRVLQAVDRKATVIGCQGTASTTPPGPEQALGDVELWRDHRPILLGRLIKARKPGSLCRVLGTPPVASDDRHLASNLSIASSHMLRVSRDPEITPLSTTWAAHGPVEYHMSPGTWTSGGSRWATSKNHRCPGPVERRSTNLRATP